MDSLSNTFNGSSNGFLMSTLKVVGMFFVGGLMDFTFFHNHPAGMALIKYFNEFLLGIYDGVLNLAGFSEFTRNTDLLTSAGVCSVTDPLTMLPMPC